MRRTRRTLLGAVPLLLAGGWLGTARADEALWQHVAAGGCAVLLRHAQTVPGIGDPPGFRHDDCSTQRNLSEAGREASRRIGAEFVGRGIRVDEVLSSRWCRCLETARLAFPTHDVRVLAPLNSFFDERSARGKQTQALRDYLARQRPPRLLVMVTHMVNIGALTGQSVGMGEALVVRTGGTNELLGRLEIG